MSWSLYLSTHLTSYLTRFRLRSTPHRKEERDAVVVQTSPVFRLPHDLFREILLSLPVLPWTEVHFRYLHGDRWYRPIPEIFWERARTLLAFSATCRVIRQIALMEAWKYYVVWRWDPRLDRTGIRLLSRCEMLLGNTHLAAHVRTLVVDFVGGPYRVAKLFVECLVTLPNLHTLEIVSMSEGRTAQSLATALEKKGRNLQQVRTLVLPPAAHWLLRYCPNVEDLTCCAAKPDERFVESLVVGGLQHITKFSVLYPEERDIWPRMAGTCPGVRELSIVHREQEESATLPMLEQCFSAFKNLSTIQLIYSPLRGRDDLASDLVWNELKDGTISQLEGSLADGAKRLKIVLFLGRWIWTDLEPKLVVEEIEV